LRSPRVRALVAAALGISLLLSVAVLLVDRLHSSSGDAIEHPAKPVSDDQSKAQVVESAREVVRIAGLQTTSAGYLLMSCKNRDDPPYQGAIYLNFAVPAGARTESYFPTIATTLVSHGWTEGLPPNGKVFGRTLSKDAVTLMVYRQSDSPGVGVLRIYGECRNMNDHRTDRSGWVDIAGDLRGPG
jgi:hypothetical protein